jgi:hypothetical protein
MDKNLSEEERFYFVDFDKQTEDKEPKSSNSVSDPLIGDLKQIENVTVKLGQQATLPCFVNNLGSFKVTYFM